MAFEKDPNEIGAMWAKQSAKGEYLSGTIEGIGAVVMFPVKSQSPKAPTWRVLKAKPRVEAVHAERHEDDDPLGF